MCLSVLISELSVILWWIRHLSLLASARPSWWSQVGKKMRIWCRYLELPVFRLLCCRDPQHYHRNPHNCKRSCWVPWKQNWGGQDLRDHQDDWLWVQVPLHQRVRSNVYLGSLHDSADHGRDFHWMEWWVCCRIKVKKLLKKCWNSLHLLTISDLMSTIVSLFSIFRVEWPPRDQRDAQRHSGHQDSDCQWQPIRERGRVNSSVFSKLHNELLHRVNNTGWLTLKVSIISKWISQPRRPAKVIIYDLCI